MCTMEHSGAESADVFLQIIELNTMINIVLNLDER
jgi:hypothetical protein